MFILIKSDRISLVKRKDKAFCLIKSKEDAIKYEANIVEQYADSDVGKRIDILIRYYPNFIRLVEGFERNLGFIIKQEKEMKRRAAIGELESVFRIPTSAIRRPEKPSTI